MKVGISIKIDVTKLDKSRFFKGEKGVYADLTTFVDLEQKDQYGNNGFIAQSQTKEERVTNAEKPPILGNVKVFYQDSHAGGVGPGSGNAPQQQAPSAPEAGGFADSDIPFAPRDKGLVI